MQIKDIDNPEMFQRLVVAIFAAEFGSDFQVVDDSGGDSGNDGFIRSRKTLFAIYCPEKKPTSQALKRKIRSDLDKAVRLRDDLHYEVEIWAFVTPQDLREPIHRFVRDQAKNFGITGIALGHTYLTDLFHRHSHLRGLFMELATPQLIEEISEIKQGIEDLKKRGEPITIESPGGEGASKRGPFEPTSERVLAWVKKLKEGSVPEAIAELDRIRMMTTNPGERLDAILILADYVDRIKEQPKYRALIEEGIKLAQQLGEPGVEAVLMANKGWVLNWNFVVMDIQGYGCLQAANLIGFSPPDVINVEEFNKSIKGLMEESDQLFQSAIEKATSTRRFREYAVVLQILGSALAQRVIFHRTVPQLFAQTREQISRLRSVYETSIRVSQTIDDRFILARGLFNYANDLRVIGDLESARTYAELARQVATENGVKEILKRLPGLMERLMEPPQKRNGQVDNGF